MPISERLLFLIRNSCKIIQPGEDDSQYKTGEDFVMVDVQFFIVAVQRVNAHKSRAELIEELKKIPEMTREQELGYIELGAILGDQGLALCLLGLGDYLWIWHLFTPKQMFKAIGIDDPELEEQAAGLGLVTKVGFKENDPFVKF